jgi:hypothetical protein
VSALERRARVDRRTRRITTSHTPAHTAPPLHPPRLRGRGGVRGKKRRVRRSVGGGRGRTMGAEGGRRRLPGPRRQLPARAQRACASVFVCVGLLLIRLMRPLRDTRARARIYCLPACPSVRPSVRLSVHPCPLLGRARVYLVPSPLCRLTMSIHNPVETGSSG